MKRERRKLALAQRQLLMARLSEREAMRALAGALGEEDRSAALEERSRELAQDYSVRAYMADTAPLVDEIATNARFTASLNTLAGQAGKARADAADQLRWQSDALGAAKTKVQRLEERERTARVGLQQAKAAREAARDTMARKLQGKGER